MQLKLRMKNEIQVCSVSKQVKEEKSPRCHMRIEVEIINEDEMESMGILCAVS